MDNRSLTHGGFTLPGEAGYEALTLQLARRWGADVIRDSDGTQLSDELLGAGYDIYSTLCLVRADNAWAQAHPDKLQQCCMMSRPVTAAGDTVEIELLRGYFPQQFRVNVDDDPKRWWQVFDRTAGREVPAGEWDVGAGAGTVTVRGAIRWHQYTVNFFSYRIWEEISMYNHVTNDWGDREHLMPIDPIHPEVRAHILDFLDGWLAGRPHTRVVRLTSLFYNFWWFWSDDPARRFLVNDWGSYEFTVSPEAIRQFEQKFGYCPASEDFVNGGLYNNSYKVPSPFYRDWIEFMTGFVADFGRVCVERIHRAGKQAFLFYNDHWLGVEPYGERFAQFGFDGIIDGIFNGFEARKVAETPAVAVRELRMHPYLFPTGVNGAPSFLPGGDPTRECRTYWTDIRRALLRRNVDRIGFGGYLHLVENHPDFIACVEELGAEFRRLRNLHHAGPPWQADVHVAILTAWGRLRAWACRGHFNRGNFYNEIMESVSGLPIEVSFLSFDDICQGGIPVEVDVLINAGMGGDAWSGGEHWADPAVIEAVCEFVDRGGGFIGVGEPSARRHGTGYFQLSPVLGVDRELGLTRAFDRYRFETRPDHYILRDAGPDPDLGRAVDDLYIIDPGTTVLAAAGPSPRITTRPFGQGRSVYFAGHHYAPRNVRLLLRAIYWAAQAEDRIDQWTCSNLETECAYFPASRQLVVVNNSALAQPTTIATPRQPVRVSLEPYACLILPMQE